MTMVIASQGLLVFDKASTYTNDNALVSHCEDCGVRSKRKRTTRANKFRALSGYAFQNEPVLGCVILGDVNTADGILAIVQSARKQYVPDAPAPLLDIEILFSGYKSNVASFVFVTAGGRVVGSDDFSKIVTATGGQREWGCGMIEHRTLKGLGYGPMTILTYCTMAVHGVGHGFDVIDLRRVLKPNGEVDIINFNDLSDVDFYSWQTKFTESSFERYLVLGDLDKELTQRLEKRQQPAAETPPVSAPESKSTKSKRKNKTTGK